MMDRLIRPLVLCGVAVMLTALAAPALAEATTVTSVTLQSRSGPPPKCAVKDQSCILSVAKLLWAQYPEQTQRYCLQEQTRAWTTRLNLEALGSNYPTGAGNGRSTEVAPALKVVCDYADGQVKAQKVVAKSAH